MKEKGHYFLTAFQWKVIGGFSNSVYLCQFTRLSTGDKNDSTQIKLKQDAALVCVCVCVLAHWKGSVILNGIKPH